MAVIVRSSRGAGIPAGVFSELVMHFQNIFDVGAGDVHAVKISEADVARKVEIVASTTDSGNAASEADERPGREPHLRIDSGGIESRKTRHRNSQVYAASGVEALLGQAGRTLAGENRDAL